MKGSLKTPVGKVFVETTADGIVRCKNRDFRPGAQGPSEDAERHLEHALVALEEYFSGARQDFDDLAVAPEGTPFQQRVWGALRKIPYGETRTYGEMASRIRRPTACRAVGAANGRNPVGIILPCHRVIGQDGSLTGYGGGLPMKEWLLRHEGAAFRVRRA